MAARSDALLRYRTIDACLRDTSKKHTLNDLTRECSSALGRRVSTRTIQLDIRFMRNNKEGYGAPIIVVGKRYYKYKDPKYSLTDSVIKGRDIAVLQNILVTLKQYATFREFGNLRSAVDIIDEEIAAIIENRESVISCESKEDYGGIEYFNDIYDAIINKKVLCIGYHSSRSNKIISMIFYPMYLKEYRGRWFAMGYKDGVRGVYRLPLDRIRDLSYSILPFPKELEFSAGSYFKEIIGVTRLSSEVRTIELLVKNKLAPYLKKNPLHGSQKVGRMYENGDMEISIDIIPNREFYTKVIELQPYLEIISPRDIGMEANLRAAALLETAPYCEREESQEENPNGTGLDDDFNLFNNV